MIFEAEWTNEILEHSTAFPTHTHTHTLVLASERGRNEKQEMQNFIFLLWVSAWHLSRMVTEIKGRRKELEDEQESVI
jgi:hypothetical protein